MSALQASIDSVRLAAVAANRLQAGDIVAYDVTKPVAITEIMFLASGANERQVLSIAEEIEKDLYLKQDHRQPYSREGLDEAQWVLLDYGDFVVHVFHQNARDFFQPDHLWKDCPRIDLLIE